MQGGGEGDRDVPLVMASPSFRYDPMADPGDGFFLSAVRSDSPQQIPAAPRASEEPPPPDDGGGDDSDVDDGDLEFAFVIKDPEAGPAITADEIFSNGQIRPIYPVFDRSLLLTDDDGDHGAPAEEHENTAAVRGTLRRLLIEDREEHSGSSSSSVADELEGLPSGTYCVWSPSLSAAQSPARCRKSGSTGSSLRWRLRDLIGRSHSDGKEKFVFLAAEGKKGKESPSRGAKGAEKSEKGKAKARGKAVKLTEMDMVTAHRIYYGKGGQAGSGGAARRSFLPYKQDLVGFFANVNGLSRTHHPF